METEPLGDNSYLTTRRGVFCGNLTEPLAYLEELGCIKELPKEAINAEIIKDYVENFKASENCLLVSATKNVEALNKGIKAALVKENLLGKEHVLSVKVEKPSGTYEKGDYLYDFEGRDFLGNGQWIDFNLKVVDRSDKTATFELKDKTPYTVDLAKWDRSKDTYRVCTVQEVRIREGERLQLKGDSVFLGRDNIHQGEVVTFLGKTDQDRIKVRDCGGIEKEVTQDTAGCIGLGYAIPLSDLHSIIKADYILVHAPENKEIDTSDIWLDLSCTRAEASVYVTDKRAFKENIECYEKAEEQAEAQRYYEELKANEAYYAEMRKYHTQSAEQFQKESSNEKKYDEITY